MVVVEVGLAPEVSSRKLMPDDRTGFAVAMPV